MRHKVVYAAVRDVRSIRRRRKWEIVKKSVNVYARGRISEGILQKISTFGLTLLYGIIEKEQAKLDIMHAHFTDAG